jgi:hypothetical protein
MMTYGGAGTAPERADWRRTGVKIRSAIETNPRRDQKRKGRTNRERRRMREEGEKKE